VVAAAAAGFAIARLLPSRAQVAAWATAGRSPDLAAVDGAIVAAARESALDVNLLRGLVAAESSGNPRAKSGAGAVGLMQLLPTTAGDQARALGLDPAAVDLEDPRTNARLGARYVKVLLAMFDGDEVFAIAAYNAGPEPVKRWRLRAPDAASRDVVAREGYPETRVHVDRVLRYRDAYAR
jgi:soluble lytic murein transglycosylase